MSVELLQVKSAPHPNGAPTDKTENDTSPPEQKEMKEVPPNADSTVITVDNIELSQLPAAKDQPAGDADDRHTKKHSTDAKDQPADAKEDAEDPSPPLSSLCFVYRLNLMIRNCVFDHWREVKVVLAILAVLTYLGYFAYCMYYEFGGEPSIRLLVGTIIGVLVLANKLAGRFLKCPCSLSTLALCRSDTAQGLRVRRIFRWALYVLSTAGAMVILGVDVVQKRPENLVCVGGLAVLILFSFFISRQPDKINWHAVYWGIGLQFWFAVVIKRTTFGAYFFQWLADRCSELLVYTDKGSETVFGPNFRDHNFVFRLMPTLIFFNAAIAVLYYMGLVQIFIAKFGKFLSFCLGTSPIECVNAAANLFLTLSEAPILIKPFMKDMTRSELFAVMTGGFASIAGFLLYVLGSFGAPINHILTASVMSAPAALAFAKLIYPDERKPTVKAEDAYRVDIRHYGSVLGALAKGAKEGLTMAGYVVINNIVFVAMLEFLDQTLQWFAARAGYQGFSFSKLLSYILYPMIFLMGFDLQDCFTAARLLGVKIFTTTVLSFIHLGKIVNNGKALQEYIATTNGTWTYVGDDVFLVATNTTLEMGVMTERSTVLATYVLCGLSSMGAIGVAIGAFATLAPTRTTEVQRMVILALVAGNMASFSTACVAGLLLTD